MSGSVLDTVDKLLESSIEETGDAEVLYKLRTARQLLSVIESRQEQVSDVLQENEISEANRQRLHDWGYID